MTKWTPAKNKTTAIKEINKFSDTPFKLKKHICKNCLQKAEGKPKKKNVISPYYQTLANVLPILQVCPLHLLV